MVFFMEFCMKCFMKCIVYTVFLCGIDLHIIEYSLNCRVKSLLLSMMPLYLIRYPVVVSRHHFISINILFREILRIVSVSQWWWRWSWVFTGKKTSSLFKGSKRNKTTALQIHNSKLRRAVAVMIVLLFCSARDQNVLPLFGRIMKFLIFLSPFMTFDSCFVCCCWFCVHDDDGQEMLGVSVSSLGNLLYSTAKEIL